MSTWVLFVLTEYVCVYVQVEKNIAKIQEATEDEKEVRMRQSRIHSLYLSI